MIRFFNQASNLLWFILTFPVALGLGILCVPFIVALVISAVVLKLIAMLMNVLSASWSNEDVQS